MPSNQEKDPLANWHSPVSDIEDAAVLAAYQDAMEDVHTRFLLNLPPEELTTADRILFQIEQAWWFYEDWICDQQDTNNHWFTTSLQAFKTFCCGDVPILASFGYQKVLLHVGRIQQLQKEDINVWLHFVEPGLYQDYPLPRLEQQVLDVSCRKINQGEEPADAAARETWEETGFDPNGKCGLTQQMDATWKKPLLEKDAVSYTEDSGKRRNYYICRGVPEDFPYAPVVRKEVAAVQWHPLDKVPKKNFAVLPILPKVRRWIKRNTGSNKTKTPKKTRDRSKGRATNETPVKSNKTPSRKDGSDHNNKKTPKSSRPRSRGKGIVQADDPLHETGLAAVGSENRWTEEDMFAANEKILGRKVEYDGNPHVFSEKGFQGMDPHHFRIVGGNFLNSETNDLAPPPPTSRLQHLFHTKGQEAGGDGDGANKDESEFLTPFFSDEGATPWGEVVEEVKETVGSPERYTMLEQDRNARGGKSKTKTRRTKKEPARTIIATADNDSDLVFLTDKEITERSQKTKLAEWKASNEDDPKYHQDLLDIQDWVNNLPKPAPTTQFGEFKFNVDALMDAFYQHY